MTFKSALKATNEGTVEIEASMRILCIGPCSEADAGSPKHDAITSILLVFHDFNHMVWFCYEHVAVILETGVI